MAKILVFGEVSEAGVTKQSLEVAAAALKLSQSNGDQVVGALIGAEELTAIASQFQCGFASLLLIRDEWVRTYLAQLYVEAAEAAISHVKPSVVLFPHSPATRDWVPQLAAKLNVGVVLDCINIEVVEGEVTATKPMYGGSVLGQLQIQGPLAFVSIRGGVFEPAKVLPNAQVEDVKSPAQHGEPRIRHLESVKIEGGSGPRLKDAKTIISGGRGIGGQENWRLIEEAATAAGAAVGCSRAIVDMGWLNWNHQIGLSGTMVSPDLYLAVGISGAVQHLAGISNAKTVVAINNDPEAEIFKRADYGVIGDISEVLPAFTARVKELQK